MDKGSESYRGKFPAVFAQGTRPMGPGKGADTGRGPAGEYHPVEILATGRYGGSRDEMSAGRMQKRDRGRDRGR